VAVAGRVVAAVNASNEVCLRVARGADLSVSPAASSSKLLRLGKLLPDAHCVDLRFAFSSTLQRIQAAVQEAATLLKDYKSCEQHLSRTYAPEAIRCIDVDKLQRDWADASGKFWLLAILSKKKVAKALGVLGGTAGVPDIEVDIPQLVSMQSLVTKIDGLASDLREVPGWSALNSDVTRMVCAAKLAEGLRANLVSLAESPEHLVKLRHELRQLVVESNGLLAPDGPIAEAVGQLAMCQKALVDATKMFGEAAGSEIDLEKDVPKLLVNAQAVVENQQAL